MAEFKLPILYLLCSSQVRFNCLVNCSGLRVIFQETFVLVVSCQFFPRASERRVLPIVGVCISSSHLHTFSSSHLLSHLLIFTSSHLHIFSSSHLLLFTSSHLHTFSHTFSSSNLLIFTSSHLHIFSSSHRLLFTSAPHTSLSVSLSLSRPRVVSAGSHETSTLSHEMRIDRQKLRKNCNFTCAGATLSHEMRVDRQKLRKNCDFTCPGATLSHEMRVHAGKIAILLVLEQPFRTK